MTPKPIVSLKDFAWRLRIPVERLRAVADNRNAHYREFSMRKGDKVRRIRPPKPELMEIQRRLNARIFCEHSPGEAAHGAVKGRSPATHAAKHAGQRCVVSMDVKSFYPSLRPRQVYEMLRSLGFGNDVSSLITRLVTLRGELPQGAPTSSVIANLICKTRLDAPLGDVAAKQGCNHSRFVDDISLSGHEPRPLINVAARLLSRMGLRIHRAKRRGQLTGKLRIEMRHAPQVVTGLLVNSQRSLTMTRSHRDAVKAAVHAVQALQASGASHAEVAKALRSALGRVSHVGRFHSALANRLQRKTDGLPAPILRLAGRRILVPRRGRCKRSASVSS